MHVWMAVRWLLPKLSDFYRRHPDVSLSIETVATEIVEPASDSDAYILYLPEPSSDPSCLTLFEEALVPVCAPVFGNSTHPLESVDDLVRYPLLHRSADKTGGVYSLCPQPSAASHPECSLIMGWFAQQAGQHQGEY